MPWNLPARALTERIFALEDREFVARQASKRALQQFLRERKALALRWLRETRLVLRYLMALHRKAVRGSGDVSLAVEMRLEIHYFYFVVVYHLLYSLIWLRGPYAAPSLVGYAANIADRFSALSGQVLARMDPALLSKIKSGQSVRPD